MNHAQTTDTRYHHHMESLQPKLLRNRPPVRHRPAHRQTPGVSWPPTLGLVCWQGVQSRSTASKHPTRALSYEAAAQVRAWRETAGFCREKLAFLAIRTAKLDSMQHRATMTPSLWIWELVGK